MIYLDSSVALAYLLAEDRYPSNALRDQSVVSSRRLNAKSGAVASIVCRSILCRLSRVVISVMFSAKDAGGMFLKLDCRWMNSVSCANRKRVKSTPQHRRYHFDYGNSADWVANGIPVSVLKPTRIDAAVRLF